MKLIGPLRKELGFRTFFNILGPLVNPARPSFQFTGVCSREVQFLYAAILKDETKNFMVVRSLDGYDEISLTDRAEVLTAAGESWLHPNQLGLGYVKPEDIRGGNPVQAASIAQEILSCRASGPCIDVVLANAGCALHTADPSLSLADSVLRAKEALSSGQALKILKKLQELRLS